MRQAAIGIVTAVGWLWLGAGQAAAQWLTVLWNTNTGAVAPAGLFIAASNGVGRDLKLSGTNTLESLVASNATFRAAAGGSVAISAQTNVDVLGEVHVHRHVWVTNGYVNVQGSSGNTYIQDGILYLPGSESLLWSGGGTLAVSAGNILGYVGNIGSGGQVQTSNFLARGAGCLTNGLWSGGKAEFKQMAAPAGSPPTDSVWLWAEDVSGTAEFKVRDEAGNTTQLSPHAIDSAPAGLAHLARYPLVLHHRNEFLGEEAWLDLPSTVQLVQALARQGGLLASNECLIVERSIPRGDWSNQQAQLQARYDAARAEEAAVRDGWLVRYAATTNALIAAGNTNLPPFDPPGVRPARDVRKPMPEWMRRRLSGPIEARAQESNIERGSAR